MSGTDDELDSDTEAGDIRVGWIYRLRKQELISDLKRFGLSTEVGTTPEITNTESTMTAFTTTYVPNVFSFNVPPQAGTVPRGYTGINTSTTQVEGWYTRRPATEMPQPTFTYPAPRLSSLETQPVINPVAHLDFVNQIRKWNVTFDGKNDAVSFLERVEELAEEYMIPKNHLVRALPELLRNQAILWYRNQKSDIHSWNDFVRVFRAFYFPREYREGLEEEIFRRVQRPQENGRDFVIQLQTLIRRHGGWTRDQELNCIYKHLLPEYRQYIRKNDVRSVMELLDQIQEYEGLTQEIRRSKSDVKSCMSTTSNWTKAKPGFSMSTPQQTSLQRPKPAPRPTWSSNSNKQSDLERLCWRCGQKGHTRLQCRQPAILFCSRCGRQGAKSIECPCPFKPGNSKGTAPEKAPTSPRN
ncbi:uncharacterized protein LOC135266664 [Tribolium castaneum]|uniref:uncharacterized protein LOC135266664 n=1 Tax=Tribolium castaneum TaxID=7070 RepID=UPI0030FF268E